jgi:ATP-dependent helicase/DNAse subunit B
LEDPPDLDGELVILETPTLYHEVEEVGRRLKTLLLQGIAPNRLAVAVPDLESYLPAIEDIARRFGLNFFHRRGVPLRDLPPILALSDLLSLWGSNWEINRILRLLESPYFYFGFAEVPRDELFSCGVSDDRAGGSFEENYNKIQDTTLLKTLEPVKKAIDNLKSAHKTLEETKSWEEFFNCFNNILDKLFWAAKENPLLHKKQEGEVFETYLKRLSQDKDSVEKFIEILDNLSEALKTSPDAPPVSLSSFRLWLDRAISQAYLFSGGSSSGTIRLLSYYDLNGTYFEALFLLGLNEKVFPSAMAEGCWWPESFIESLAKTALGRPLWTGAVERYQQDEEIVAAALSQGSSVTLTYHNTNDERRPILPSPLIGSLKALWPEGLLKETKTGWPLPPSPELISDPGELWLHLAKNYPEQNPVPPELSILSADTKDPKSLWVSFFKRRSLKKHDFMAPDLVAAWINSLQKYKDCPLLSISPLVNFAGCPRKFWYENILKLSSVEGEAIEDWSPQNQGDVIHRTLKIFMEENLKKLKNKRDLSSERLLKIYKEQILE